MCIEKKDGMGIKIGQELLIENNHIFLKFVTTVHVIPLLNAKVVTGIIHFLSPIFSSRGLF